MISQPGVADGPGGARAGGVARQATLVPATPGWEICGLNNLKIPIRCVRSTPALQVMPYRRFWTVDDWSVGYYRVCDRNGS